MHAISNRWQRLRAQIAGSPFFGRPRLLRDGINPILVKELRQGLRSNTFSGALTVLQLLLAVFGITMLVSQSFDSDAEAGTVFFWSVMAIPLLLLIPASAALSVRSEQTGNTLELIQLTNLSARRIVFGKWLSVVTQTGLIVITALPYILVRYFAGGIDIWSELFIVVTLYASSAILSGTAMGFWATAISPWLKWVCTVGAIMVLAPSATTLLTMSAYRRSHIAGSSPEGLVLAFAGYGMLLLVMLLELGAKQIAPPAENHTTSFRVFGWLTLAVPCVLLPFSTDWSAFSAVVGVLLLVLVVLSSLVEAVRPIPSLYAPFSRPLTRMLLHPFSPGWPGGVSYSFISCAAVALLHGLYTTTRNDDPFLDLVVTGAVFWPVVFCRTVFRRIKNQPACYVALLLLSALPFYVSGFARGFEDSTVATIVAEAAAHLSGFFPASVVLFSLLNSTWPATEFTRSIAVIVSLVSILVACVLAARQTRIVWALGRLGQLPIPSVASAHATDAVSPTSTLVSPEVAP